MRGCRVDQLYDARRQTSSGRSELCNCIVDVPNKLAAGQYAQLAPVDRVDEVVNSGDIKDGI